MTTDNLPPIGSIDYADDYEDMRRRYYQVVSHTVIEGQTQPYVEYVCFKIVRLDPDLCYILAAIDTMQDALSDLKVVVKDTSHTLPFTADDLQDLTIRFTAWQTAINQLPIEGKATKDLPPPIRTHPNPSEPLTLA